MFHLIREFCLHSRNWWSINIYINKQLHEKDLFQINNTVFASIDDLFMYHSYSWKICLDLHKYWEDLVEALYISKTFDRGRHSGFLNSYFWTNLIPNLMKSRNKCFHEQLPFCLHSCRYLTGFSPLTCDVLSFP